MKKYDVCPGMKFTRLTVIEYAQNYKWKCKCECGNDVFARGCDLVKGMTKSCGCLRIDRVTKMATKHGDCEKRIYKIWGHIKSRCNSPNDDRYKDYGGRGIKICEEWESDYTAFKSWSISNGYAENLSIDRINNDGNYEPSNCRWITNKEQLRNMRRNRILTFNGESHCVAEWADIVGMSYDVLITRIKRGWDTERALTEPVINRI